MKWNGESMKKKILLEDIAEEYRRKSNNKHVYDSEYSEYRALVEYIEKLSDKGVLKPVKAQGTNGKSPALHKVYWRITEDKDYSVYIEELQYKISTQIDIEYYLQHLKQYHDDRQYVLQLSEYLITHSDMLDRQVSINERSFEIWQREKFLKDGEGMKILKRTGIDIDRLNIYQTSEPLVYYTCNKRIPQNMLIIENKDTFYSMRKLLLEDASDDILGMSIGTLIYGAGKGVLRSFRDFEYCTEPYIKDGDNRLYYFGDIDYEGIIIYENLRKLFVENREIKPFIQAYQKMIDIALSRYGLERLPDTKRGQNKNISNVFMSYFDEEYRSKLLEVLQSGKYIPQEIIDVNNI